MITDPLKSLFRTFKMLGFGTVTGKVSVAGFNNGFLGDNWTTLNIEVESLNGAPVTSVAKFMRAEITPRAEGYRMSRKLELVEGRRVEVTGRIGCDHPHPWPEIRGSLRVK